MAFNKEEWFHYYCALVDLSRNMSGEDVGEFKKWLVDCTDYDIGFSENQISEMDKYTILHIFEILKSKELIKPWCNNILTDFLKERNLERHFKYPINPFQKKSMETEEPSPVETFAGNLYTPQYQFFQAHCGAANPEYNKGFTRSAPTSPPNYSFNPMEFNIQNNVYANETTYHAGVNGGAMTINNLTYNGPIQVAIKSGESSPESSPVEDPCEVDSPITPDFIDTIASEIGREWKTVARKGFQLEEGKIDEIEYDSRRLKDQVVRMITMWTKVSIDCSQLAFAKALCKSNLRGIVKGNFPPTVSRMALS